ncbi:MAG: 3-deoxy-manno-octulosonate cytidylyltransferase [Alphaproteobacteria bacterium]|nr:3-deoxy-manno-octulosonate cytidylyltransferase [Alphaproteobacteria bacterium]
MKPIVLIPARLASTRLPNKMLADIGGLPMVVRSAFQAREADIGRVVVAAADPEIMEAVRDHGLETVATDPAHPSGSDRIWEACSALDPDGRHDVVINVQGDNPTLDPAAVRACLDPLAEPAVDIATIAAPIVDEAERDDPAAVKPVVSWRPDGRVGRALYFTRATAPYGEGELFHHIGLYAFRRPALQRFVSLPPSPLEEREKLEQLRALEDGMRIDVARIDSVPLTVDTPADLDRARAVIASAR